MKMNNYTKYKERAIQEAKEYQLWASEQSLSWGEVAAYCDYFYHKAQQYGLVKEFRENGII